MARFEMRSAMPASADSLFDWHARTRAFERLNPPFDRVELEQREGQGIEVGTRLTLRMRIGPLALRWVAEHVALEPGRMFRDVQRSGPFEAFEHTHLFEDEAITDTVEWELPFGALGRALAGGFSRAHLERVFAYRHAVLRADLTRHARFAGQPRLTVGITGASGLIGSALVAYLDTAGHAVRTVPRSDFSVLEGCDAVVHLAGAPIGRRWTATAREQLVSSRVGYTRALVAALRALPKPPRVLISGSAVGVYGERGDELLDESSALGLRADRGPGFLAALCADWEREAATASDFARVVTLRTGVVLAAHGGALARLLPAFRAGAGGPIGSGRQFVAWVSLEDVLGAVEHALHDQALRGPLNLTAPEPRTNLELSRELGRVLGRPSAAQVPAFVLRAMLGEAADAALLASQRVRPARLLAAGFSFVHPRLEDCLRFTLGR